MQRAVAAGEIMGDVAGGAVHGIDRQRGGRGGPGVDRKAEDGEAEIEPEDPDQQWRALNELGVDGAEQLQRRHASEAHQRDDRADGGTAEEGDAGQRQGPAHGGDQEQHVDPGELPDHRRPNATR